MERDEVLAVLGALEATEMRLRVAVGWESRRSSVDRPAGTATSIFLSTSSGSRSA